MIKKIKLFFLLCFILCYQTFFSSVTPVFAGENFNTTLTTTYTVDRQGNTIVEHQFTIKNLTPEYYINKYGLQLSTTSIENIKIYHFDKEVNAEVVKSANETSIGVTFEDKIVGEGKINQFKIVYQDPDVAQINGQVLEVNIPRLANPEEYDQREVRLATPIYYGHPQRVNSNNYQISQEGESFVAYFPNPGGEAISALFGKEQLYSLKLEYHLKNNTSNTGITQITLPPDTAWQKINYQFIDPLPTEIKADQDGNWLATYQLPANTSLIVRAEAFAKISIEPDNQIPAAVPSADHLTSQKFWEVNHPQIKELSDQYTDVKQIYQFVVNTLDYTDEDITQKLERLGAVVALEKNNKATCQEFTDLFITLSRAKNIAARRITGYAYSTNEKLRPLGLDQDILHAWPEYFDPSKNYWIAVDPTWEDTTGGVDYFNQFDLNHLVFAINGIDSQLPFPAGSYQDAENSGKTVEVAFVETIPENQPNFSLEFNPRKESLSLLPGLYELEIKNNTGQAWYQLQLEINSEADILVEQNININNLTLLPYQTKTLPMIVYNKQSWVPAQTALTVKLKNPNYEDIIQNYQAKTAPKIHHFVYNPIFFASVGIGSIIFTLIAGSILVFRRKK